MSWLIAGIAVAGSVLSTSEANKAERDANELSKYQDLLDVERLKSDTAISELNTRRDLASLESEQVAMASAMGKRSSGQGFQRMQDVSREDMETNIARDKREVERAEKFGKVSASARDRATSSSTTARNIGTMTTGLLSFSRAFK